MTTGTVSLTWIVVCLFVCLFVCFLLPPKWRRALPFSVLTDRSKGWSLRWPKVDFHTNEHSQWQFETKTVCRHFWSLFRLPHSGVPSPLTHSPHLLTLEPPHYCWLCSVASCLKYQQPYSSSSTTIKQNNENKTTVCTHKPPYFFHAAPHSTTLRYWWWLACYRPCLFRTFVSFSSDFVVFVVVLLLCVCLLQNGKFFHPQFRWFPYGWLVGIRALLISKAASVPLTTQWAPLILIVFSPLLLLFWKRDSMLSLNLWFSLRSVYLILMMIWYGISPHLLLCAKWLFVFW